MNFFKIISLFIGLFLLGFSASATHNRAGEITYTRIAPFEKLVGGEVVPVYKYRITVIVYTDDGSNVADRCVDTVHFGDGERGLAFRTNGGTSLGCACSGTVQCGELIISQNSYRVKKNIYIIEHVYPSSGTYTIQMFDPNRNNGVHNIPNSDQYPFYLESVLVIANESGPNTSPIFACAPIYKACLGKCFYHSPCAYDPDGDSLSYEITTSRGFGGSTVPGYFYPETGPGGSYSINAITGIISWCTPQIKAEYNIAFIVKEWRRNSLGTYVLIGYVLRDMQVLVDACADTDPPTVIVPADTCVEVGATISKKIYVNDADKDQIKLSGNGGAFAGPLPRATLSTTNSTANYSSTFQWQTDCNHLRQQPYQTTFRVEETSTPPVVANYGVYNIRVVPPSVKNVTAVPTGSAIKVSWSLSTCSPSNNPLVAYKIYRRDSCTTFVFDPCETGVPSTSGYVLLNEASSSTSEYTDNNNGGGLVVGRSYSYLVVARYQDGTLTFASSQVCVKLKRDIPAITHVDVLSTSTNSGAIAIKWLRPITNIDNMDTLVHTGPYSFLLKHRYGGIATFSTVATFTSNYFLGLATTYTHTSINTADTRSEYQIEFIAGTSFTGNGPLATSVFLNTVGADRQVRLSWSAETPWANYKYDVYKKAPGETSFSFLASTSQTSYTDKDSVVNKYAYCYKVISSGEYSDPSILKPLINNSQESCATAIDSTAPCSPIITIDANCPNGFLNVSWNDLTLLPCGDDVVSYILKYKATVDGTYEIVYEGNSRTYTYDGIESVSGCYVVQAKDSVGNLSKLSPDFCVENCPEFELPNVVTANEDEINDFYKAIKVRFIKEIDLKIYDRWGNLVYTTKDPYFQWNTVSQFSNEPVSEGTFFYTCDVFEPRLKGVVKRSLKGWMQVIQ